MFLRLSPRSLPSQGHRVADLLADLDGPALRAFAAAFSTLARAAEDRARRLDRERLTRREAEAIVDALPRLALKVADKIAEGMTREAAVAAVAQAAAVPPETVALYCRRFARGRESATAEARRLAIIRAALAGRRNGEIAEALGVSRRTVERALAGIRWGRSRLPLDSEACQDSLGIEFRPSEAPR